MLFFIAVLPIKKKKNTQDFDFRGFFSTKRFKFLGFDRKILDFKCMKNMIKYNRRMRFYEKHHIC